MKINWLRMLSQNNIPYIERGANVKRGNINIKCPFCGISDPSYHLGVDITTGWWACWRNNNHRGKSPVRLLVKLLRISYDKAREIAGIEADYVDPDGFDSVAARLMNLNVKEVKSGPDSLEYPSTFKPISTSNSVRRFFDYMVFRGFLENDVSEVSYKYKVYASKDYEFNDRVVFPYIVENKIVSWTGRAIAPSSIRYKALSHEKSIVVPEDTFYNYDSLIEGGDALIVVEGPIDALKLDFYGRDFGVRSVAISTNSLKESQKYILEEFCYNFKRVIFMMDNTSKLSILDSVKMKNSVNIPNGEAMAVPYGSKDTGDLSPSSIITFCRSL